MKVTLGINSYSRRQQGRDIPVIWDSKMAINGHTLIVGSSGTGKTHTILRLIQAMNESSVNAVRFHVFDVHGDIEIRSSSSVKFSEATPYGFNPLVINPDPDFGGVRKRIQSFIAAVNKTSRQLGTKQESVLRAILQDLYVANGFYDGKPESWKLDDGIVRRYAKKYPTLQDAVRFANAKLKAMYIGTDSKAVSALEQLNKRAASFHAKAKVAMRSAGQGEEIARQAQAEIEKMADPVIQLYSEYVRSVLTGRELDDMIKYDSREVLKSVVDRLDNLNAIGIFHTEPPPFDERSNVWRYDIRALNNDEKLLFVRFRLEDIFARAMQAGVEQDITEVIVLDEAHLFFSDEPDNPINMIAKEARKFGLAQMCASQSPTHFSDDFLSNCGTKIILGIDEMYWGNTVRKLNIEQKVLEYITPRKTMAVQIKNSGDLRPRFVGVEI